MSDNATKLSSGLERPAGAAGWGDSSSAALSACDRPRSWRLVFATQWWRQRARSVCVVCRDASGVSVALPEVARWSDVSVRSTPRLCCFVRVSRAVDATVLGARVCVAVCTYGQPADEYKSPD